MGKKTFATVQVKNKASGAWEPESRELTPDDLVMYALLQDLLHGLDHQVINTFLSRPSTDERRTLLAELTTSISSLYRGGSLNPKSAAHLTEAGTGSVAEEETSTEDFECFPPLSECWDGSCRLVCPPPPNGDK